MYSMLKESTPVKRERMCTESDGEFFSQLRQTTI